MERAWELVFITSSDLSFIRLLVSCNDMTDDEVKVKGREKMSKEIRDNDMYVGITRRWLPNENNMPFCGD